jgi:hypothetical protein
MTPQEYGILLVIRGVQAFGFDFGSVPIRARVRGSEHDSSRIAFRSGDQPTHLDWLTLTDFGSVTIKMRPISH